MLQAYRGALEALYRLYEGLLGYHADLVRFLTRIREGAYIHSNLESLLLVREKPRI